MTVASHTNDRARAFGFSLRRRHIVETSRFLTAAAAVLLLGGLAALMGFAFFGLAVAGAVCMATFAATTFIHDQWIITRDK